MQTSFIPKKPIVAQTKLGGSSTISLFSFLATALFIVALAVSGAVFAYKSYVAKQITVDAATLERAKGAFEPELINQLVRLDTRIEAAQDLMASHLAVTPLFDYLSTVTLQSVRFRDFDFSYLGQGKVLLSMRGQAQSYATVALQSDLLNEQVYLKDALISNIALDPSGSVSFSVTASVDPSLISYSSSLAPAAQTQEAPQTTQTP